MAEGGGSMGRPAAHESAARQIAGEALYIDDMPVPAGTLHAYCLTSPKAHARIVSVDLTAVRAFPGVHAALAAGDLPGANDVGPIFKGEPFLADGVVEYIGQPVVAIAATSIRTARAAAKLAKIAGCVSLPPNPPPMRRIWQVTAAAGTPSARATIFCTSVGCWVDDHTVISPPSSGKASAMWPSR